MRQDRLKQRFDASSKESIEWRSNERLYAKLGSWLEVIEESAMGFPSWITHEAPPNGIDFLM